MILPLRVLGRESVKRMSSGRARAPISLTTWARSSWRSASLGGLARLERDEGGDRLALQVVGLADDGGLGHLGVADQGALDLHRREPVAGDVQDVVDAAHDPVVAVLVAAGAVAGEVAAGDLAPVLLPCSARRRRRGSGASTARAA